MGLEDEVAKACKKIIGRKIENDKEQRRALIDRSIRSAVTIIERYNIQFSREGITAGGNYTTGGYEAIYSGESINGSIAFEGIEFNPAEDKQADSLILTVNCKAHSCVTRTSYKGDIPESDIFEFIEYATRKPTLIDRWRKMTKEYDGEL